jgi:hypothetical protein
MKLTKEFSNSPALITFCKNMSMNIKENKRNILRFYIKNQFKILQGCLLANLKMKVTMSKTNYPRKLSKGLNIQSQTLKS